MNDILGRYLTGRTNEMVGEKLAKTREEGSLEGFIKGALLFGADEELLLARVMTEFPVTREETIEIIKNVKAML